MTFKLDESTWDQQLGALNARLRQFADELDAAATLKAGAMDSQNRTDEIAAEVRRTLLSVSKQLREMSDTSAVIGI